MTKSTTKPVRPVANPHCQPETAHDLLLARARFLQNIRRFFIERDFLEVETPVLIPQADPSPHLDSFSTQYKTPLGATPQRRMYLRTSPEFAMKELLAAGYPRIFQICKFFRNGESTSMHNPEFTGLEWYEAGQTYERLMELTEAMCKTLWPQPTLEYQGHVVDIGSPWERLTVHEAFARYADLVLPNEIHRDHLADACRARSIPVLPEDSEGGDAWDDLFFKLFLTYIEPHLGMKQPTFLLDYPIQMAALSRAKPGAPHIAERVELYIAGLELANGYSELTDPQEQRRRMEAACAYRRTFGADMGLDTDIAPDAGLLNALEWGMPPSTGIAIGLDRLLMLERNAPSIQDVMPFPLAAN